MISEIALRYCINRPMGMPKDSPDLWDKLEGDRLNDAGGTTHILKSRRYRVFFYPEWGTQHSNYYRVEHIVDEHSVACTKLVRMNPETKQQLSQAESYEEDGGTWTLHDVLNNHVQIRTFPQGAGTGGWAGTNGVGMGDDYSSIFEFIILG